MNEMEIAFQNQKVRHAGLHRLGNLPNINCLCGETDPACFEREHIGRKKYDGTVWGRCCNCHRKITARQLKIRPGIGLPPENLFNRMGHGFLGRYEYDQFNANFMLQSAELMFKLEANGIKIED